MDTNWKTYEEVGEYLLNQFHEKLELREIEKKQKVQGYETGTQWEIDAKGIKENDTGFLVIEFRRHTKSKLNQESLAALAFRIDDTGADGGIIVSPLGLQAGAKMVAEAKNILPIQIDPNSTKNDYFISFLNELMFGVTDSVCVSDNLQIDHVKKCTTCGEDFNANDNEEICANCIKQI